MIDLESLLSKATRLLGLETPPASELRRLSVELDDLINSSEYATLDPAAQAQVQELLQTIRGRIRGSEAAAVLLPSNMPGLSENSFAPARSRVEERQHNPYAQEAMEEAESLFYGGRYAESIKLYDQVLSIEPDWDRARRRHPSR